MTELLGWLLAGINATTLVVIGITYGDARARLINIEKRLDEYNTRLLKLEDEMQ